MDCVCTTWWDEHSDNKMAKFWKGTSNLREILFLSSSLSLYLCKSHSLRLLMMISLIFSNASDDKKMVLRLSRLYIVLIRLSVSLLVLNQISHDSWYSPESFFSSGERFFWDIFMMIWWWAEKQQWSWRVANCNNNDNAKAGSTRAETGLRNGKKKMKRMDWKVVNQG